MSNSPTLTANFVQALKYYKAVSGKRNKDIAAAIDVPETTFSSWINGTHLPNMSKLQILADYLNAPITQFFNFTAPQDDPLIADIMQEATMLTDEDKELLRLVALRLNK